MNFRRLLEYNQQKMPFAAAQIGLGFRNEIAPRNGLLRVREFCMAEIEHFLDPEDKSHPKFKLIAGKSLVLFPQEAQLGTGRVVNMTVGEAVSSGIIDNETLGYFMARTQLFLEKIGVDPVRMRFRQHLKTEMAHYAKDCWDMEIKMSYGWIECVGHADRAAYDLCQHSQRTGVPLVAPRRLATPYTIDRSTIEPNKKLIGPIFKGNQKKVLDLLESLDEGAIGQLQSDLSAAGSAGVNVGGYLITPDLVSFKSEKKIISEEKYTPSVVEPAFGIGRIIYAVLEHSFSQRDGDEQRCVMSFHPCVAPIKVGIYRLLNNPQFEPFIYKIRSALQSANITNKVDSSAGTIGRRYARSDELGIAFGVTIDFQTLIDDTVTVRERDSMSQIRVPFSSLVGLIQSLVSESIKWDTAMRRFTVINAGGDAEQEEEGKSSAESKSSASVAPAAPVIVERFTRGSFSRPNVNFKG